MNCTRCEAEVKPPHFLCKCKEHIFDEEDPSNCWCNPYLNYVNPSTGLEHWVHREFEQ